ncbi:MAG: hypothetical protein LC768_08005, partial [Acidobacteria bacterium]|nr:hypothetical protein [Acidobacteriota bacterium]
TYDNSEYVNFEQWDASAMSYRSTMTDGSTISWEGTEGSPAELDPLGGNVGLSTPYIAPEPIVPEPEIPTLENLYDEANKSLIKLI